jgi:hypothetical protein
VAKAIKADPTTHPGGPRTAERWVQCNQFILDATGGQCLPFRTERRATDASEGD